MTEKIHSILQQQRDYFNSHQTLEIEFRLRQLRTLRKAVLSYEDRIYQALWKDLHKSKVESYITEFGIVLREISLHIRKLKSWARPEHVATDQLLHFWSSSRILKEPYGIVLIISTWNYPFMLVMSPLIGAMSAGNCMALKPSEHSGNTEEIIGKMISDFFPAPYISVHPGGVETSKALLLEKWDYIFFTGSQEVGKAVMEAASHNLTPVTLELGGKNPCIVDEDANLKKAAARIAWGKLVNAGQTCIAPDYLLVNKRVKKEFLELLKKSIRKYYGDNPRENPEYVRIVNEPKTERLSEFLKGMNTYYGGDLNFSERFVSPTILVDVAPDDPVMKEEIFGPVLPVLEFESIEEAINFINGRPKPLALYYFSQKTAKQKMVLRNTSSGGASINDVIVHFASDYMPFGGVGSSGMGGYHGKFSFDLFSHKRSVMKKVTWIDIPLRYPPYGNKLPLVKWFINR